MNEAAFFGVWATALAWSREYGVLILVFLLFGWLVISWLSNTTSQVNALSLVLKNVRKDLDELKGQVKSLKQALDQQSGG